MKNKRDIRGTPGQSRRQFLKQTAAAAGANLFAPAVFGQQRPFPVPISINPDPTDEVARQQAVCWAMEQLQESLTARKVPVQLMTSFPGFDYAYRWMGRGLPIVVAGRDSTRAQQVLKDAELSIPNVPEALALIHVRPHGQGFPRIWLASGADVRGVVYALLELADRVQYAENPLAELQKPATVVVGGTSEVKGKLAESLAAARGILGLDFGFSYHFLAQQGWVPTVGASAGVAAFIQPGGDEALFPQLDLVASYRLGSRFLAYFGSQSMFQFRSEPTVVLAPFVGGEWRAGDRFSLDIEAKWYAPTEPTHPRDVNYSLPIAGKGAVGFVLGANWVFGGKHE